MNIIVYINKGGDIRRGIGGTSSSQTIRPPSSGDSDYRPPIPIPRAGSVSSTSVHSTTSNHSSSSVFYSNSVPASDAFDNFNRPPMPLPSQRSSDPHPPVPRRTGGSTSSSSFTTQTSRPGPISSSTSMRLPTSGGPPPSYSSLDHDTPPVPSRRGNVNTIGTR